MTKRIAAFLGVSVLVMGSVVACSSSFSGGGGGGVAFSCDTESKCSADPATDKAACENEVNGTCATEYKSFGSCTFSNQTCGGNNTTDEQALIQACKPEFEAYAKCKAGDAGKDGG
jgi:hypothetical protein